MKLNDLEEWLSAHEQVDDPEHPWGVHDIYRELDEDGKTIHREDVYRCLSCNDTSDQSFLSIVHYQHCTK